MPTDMQFRIREKDEMPQVLIPAGEFLIGSTSNDLLNYYFGYYPQRRIYLSAFWMDLHAVTTEQYRAFCIATDWHLVKKPTWGWPLHHPMVGVSWKDAQAYTQYVGAALPTEAQWEKAARGGLEGKLYPWGDTFDATLVGEWPGGGYGVTPVALYAPNGFGLFDMTGNVWEWCDDWYDREYYASMPNTDPHNTSPGQYRVLRGGEWGRRATVMSNPKTCGALTLIGHASTGFRCASPV